MKNNEYETLQQRYDREAQETITRERVAAQAKYDRLSPEERAAVDADAAERLVHLPWHPDHGNAPQHSMSDTPVPNTKNVQRF